jgi:PilZ domain
MSLAQATGIPIIGRSSTRPGERRRSSRYRCSGLADALRIPSIGNSIKATISDISLHGCRILTELPFEPGVPLDLLLRVKSISFRASGHVKVVRGPAEIGIEFSRMSTGGERRLTELLAELDRLSSILMMTRKVCMPQVIEGEYGQVDSADSFSRNALVVSDALSLPMPTTAAPGTRVVRSQRTAASLPMDVDVYF